MSTQVMAYRAICGHGKVSAMTVDDSTTTMRCLADLREFKKWASSVDHVTIEEARKSDFGCDACDKRRSKRRK